jgi:chemotaxis response regulator CheB
MMKNTYRGTRSTLFPADRERATGKARIHSVLCIHDNPVFLDRICRHLEQRGDLSVDISISVEDALHLMRYVRFDVIVTDYTFGQMEKNGFLKIVRDTGNTVPFIYFTRIRNAEVEAEARPYCAVHFVDWGEESVSQGFEELYLSVKKAAAENRMKNASRHGGFF